MKSKTIIRMAAAFCMGLLLTASPVLAASDTVKYTITLRPGSIAQFSEEFKSAYVNSYGAEITGKTGSIKVKLSPGQTIPMLPDDGDLVYKENAKGRYTMNTDWYPDSNVVTGNESFVVKYDALVNAVEYKVRYVDRQSGEDVAPPMITQGNVGQSYTYYSQQIAGYSCDVTSQSITLTSSGDNVITFQYTSTMTPEVNRVEVPGDTIIQEEIVPGNTTVMEHPVSGGTTTGTGVDAGAETVTEKDANSDTTTGNATTETPVGMEVIEDEDVPLGQMDLEDTESDKESQSPLPWVLGGTAVVAIGVLAGLYFYKNRKH